MGHSAWRASRPLRGAFQRRVLWTAAGVAALSGAVSGTVVGLVLRPAPEPFVMPTSIKAQDYRLYDIRGNLKSAWAAEPNGGAFLTFFGNHKMKMLIDGGGDTQDIPSIKFYDQNGNVRFDLLYQVNGMVMRYFDSKGKIDLEMVQADDETGSTASLSVGKEGEQGRAELWHERGKDGVIKIRGNDGVIFFDSTKMPH